MILSGQSFQVDFSKTSVPIPCAVLPCFSKGDEKPSHSRENRSNIIQVFLLAGVNLAAYGFGFFS